MMSGETEGTRIDEGEKGKGKENLASDNRQIGQCIEEDQDRDPSHLC